MNLKTIALTILATLSIATVSFAGDVRGPQLEEDLPVAPHTTIGILAKFERNKPGIIWVENAHGKVQSVLIDDFGTIIPCHTSDIDDSIDACEFTPPTTRRVLVKVRNNTDTMVKVTYFTN